ncbi:MAG: caspase family protein [Acidobacteria bacterium]|nr:caspase family protein [Acidobacteriota bacterium]
MRTVLFTLACVAAFAQPRDLGVESNQKLALVVGNAAYPKWPLRNPLNDARAVVASLQDVGFQAEVAADVSLRNLEAAVNRFVAKVKNGDVAVFYYAGHGIQLEGENYLVPVDFDAKDEADAKYASYSASRVQERLEKAGARVIVVVLDACRNNPFQATRSAGGGLAAMGSGKGTLIAFATAPGKTADDNPRGQNGLFTSHLVSTPREPGLSLDKVFNRVREQVYKDSQGRQVPWTVSSVIGDVYLRPGQAQAAAARPAPVNPLARNVVPAPVQERIVAPTFSAADTQAALDRGDFQGAIDKAQEVLRGDPNHVDALKALTSGYYRTQQWQLFVNTARQALNAGAELQFLVGHHHTLTPAHPSVVTITKAKISYKSLGGTCNQQPFEYETKQIVSAQVVNSPKRETFLNVRVLDEKNKQKNLNFADPDSQLSQDANGLPVVVSPPKAAAQLQAVGAVLMSARQGGGI